MPQHSFAFNSLHSSPPSLPRATLNNQPPTTHSHSLPPGHFLFQRHGRPPSRLPSAFLPQVPCFAESRLLRQLFPPVAPLCTGSLSPEGPRARYYIARCAEQLWSRSDSDDGGRASGRVSDVDFHFTRLANAPPPIGAMEHQIRQSLMHAPPSRSASRPLARSIRGRMGNGTFQGKDWECL